LFVVIQFFGHADVNSIESGVSLQLFKGIAIAVLDVAFQTLQDLLVNLVIGFGHLITLEKKPMAETVSREMCAIVLAIDGDAVMDDNIVPSGAGNVIDFHDSLFLMV
jgi:hypothetical protein